MGGNGGNGGNGSVGAAVTADTIKAGLDVAYDTFTSVNDGSVATAYGLIAASFTEAAIVAETQVDAIGVPVISELGVPLGELAGQYTEMAADEAGEVLTQDTAKAAFDGAYLTAITVTNLAVGTAGNGGTGGNAGNAGNASFGFGGGAGGNGGNGGDAVSASAAAGGAGGNGGAGGTGGFGGGGGNGGNGGSGGASASAEPGTEGGAGSGGIAGFGGGAGSSGTGYGVLVDDGGSGGSGYGGAIFVRNGGSLTITGSSVFQFNNVVGGGTSTVSGSNGNAAGVDLFIMKGANVVLNPGAGNAIVFNGGIADDAGLSAGSSTGRGAGITIASGLVVFNAANTYSGQTNIIGGTLQAQDGTGISSNSSIDFNGNAAVANGVLQSSGSFTRYVGTYNATTGLNANRVQWDADGGFAAVGGGLNVMLNGITNNPLTNAHSAALVWSSTDGFLTTGHTLIFGSETATDNVTFFNNINLNGGNRQISVTANLAQPKSFDNATAVAANVDNAIITGVLSNGSLTVGDATHTGTLILTNANTYAGGTTINGGMLVLANFYNPNTNAVMTTGSLNANGAVTVNTGATFDFSQTGDQAIGSLAGGGTVSMGGNTLTINQSTSTTFSGVLADGGLGDGTGASVVKNGSGNLTLGGANTYTGSTQINAGTVTLTGSLVSPVVGVASGATLNDEAGGLASNTALTNNGTLNQDSDDTIASLVNTGTINNSAHTLTAATYALNDGSVVNANLGTGALTANGTVALNGTSSAETVEIASGTTTLGSAERLLDTAAVTIDDGATLTLGGNEKIASLFGAGDLANAGGRLTVDSGDFSGVISGTGGLTKVSTDTLTLSGANTYTGSTLINVGTLALTGSLVSDTINVSSGATLSDENSGLASNATLTNDGTVNQDSDDTIAALINTGTINNSDYTLTAATYALNDGSVINANLGTGIVTANGTVALNGTSSAATVNIVTGTTTLGSAERLLDTSVVTVSSGAKLALGGDEKIGTINGAGEVSVQDGTLTVDDGTFSGVISGTDDTHGLTKVSSGLLTLSGANTYVGTTQINAGTVTLTGSLASLTVNVASGATLNDEASGLASGAAVSNDGTLNQNSDDTVASLVNTGTINNSDYTLTAATYALNDGSVINANLGTGIVTANGTVALNGTSSAATVNIVTGTTTLGSAERLLDTAAVTIDDGATLTLGGDEKIGSLFGAGVLANAGGTLTVDSGDFSGVISGTGGLTKVSSDTLTLSGDNTYTGDTQIDAGTVDLTGSLVSPNVNVTSGTTLNDKSGGLADNTVATVDGTLALTASDAIDTLFGSGSVTIDSTSILTVNRGYFSGVISGEGGLVVADPPLVGLTLTNANTYTGGTTVNSGALLALAGDGSLYSAGAVAVNGTFDISQANNDQTIGDLSGAGTVQLGDRQLTLGTDGDSTYSGVIENGGLGGGTDGGLVKQGSGNFTLTGTSTVPTINVAAGTLTLAGTTPNLATTTAVTVATGATLAVNNDNTIDTLTTNGTVSGTKTLTATTYNLNDGTHINGKLGNVSAVGGSTVYTNGAVYFNASVEANTLYVQTGLLTVAAPDILSHDATVDISTGATLSLTGGNQTINTLTGAGTLILNGYSLNVTDGGTYTGTTTNTGSLTKTGTGTLTLTGDNTFNQGTNVNEGTVTVTGGGTLTTTSTSVDGGTLQVDSGGTLTTSGTTVSNGTLVNNGTITNNVTITSTGTLMGSGTVTGNVTGNGTTAPGGSPGVLHVLGNYTENGTLQIELADASGPSTDNILGYDQVAVSGKTVLNPTTSTLTVGHPTYTPTEMATATYITNAAAIAAFDPAKGQTFTIINGAPGSITGHFATFTNTFANDVIFNVSTGQLVGTGLATGQDLLLALPGASANLRQMIANLKVGDHQYAGGDLLPLLLGAGLTPAQVNVIADKSSPEAYAGFSDYADHVTRSYTDKAVNLTPLVDTGKYAVFAGYSNIDTGSSSSANQADYDLKSNGAVAGARAALNSRLTVGLFGAFDSGSVDSTYLHSNVKGNVFGVFGEYTAKADRSLTLTASLSHGSYSTDGTRQTATSTSSFHGVDSSANLAALALRYRILQRKTVTITPELSLSYIAAKADGFTETNPTTLQALNVHSQSNSGFTTEAAVNATVLVGSKLSFNGRLGVSHDFADASRDVSANVVTESQSFTVTAPGMGDTAFNLGLGANYSLTANWSAGISYQASFASDAKVSNSFYLSTTLGL